MTGLALSHSFLGTRKIKPCRTVEPGLLGSWLCLPGLLGALVPPAGVVGAAAAGVGTTPPPTPPLCLIV